MPGKRPGLANIGHFIHFHHLTTSGDEAKILKAEKNISFPPSIPSSVSLSSFFYKYKYVGEKEKGSWEIFLQ